MDLTICLQNRRIGDTANCVLLMCIHLTAEEKLMVTLFSCTGMRFEEVLGIRWNDINEDWITIQRAVVHPKRNASLIRKPKTKTSNRIIPYKKELKDLIEDCRTAGYILAADKGAFLT